MLDGLFYWNFTTRRGYMKKALLLYLSNLQAATAIEYGLIACGIALAIVASVFVFGDSLEQVYGAMPAALSAASAEVETGR